MDVRMMRTAVTVQGEFLRFSRTFGLLLLSRLASRGDGIPDSRSHLTIEPRVS